MRKSAVSGFFFLNLFSVLFLNQALPAPNSDKTKIINIDGKIEESEWENARVFKNFYITIPETEAKDYDSTTVWIKQDEEAIYLALRIFPRGKVISKSLVRDRGVEEDNEVIVTLDLENKQKNGFSFYFNYINNQRDYLVYNEKNLSQEWDWVWEARSTLKNGMTESEVKIPVDRIQNKNSRQIGINVTVFAYRPDGSWYYYSIVPGNPLDYVRNTYKMDITPFNEKTDFRFALAPFAVGEKFNERGYRTTLGSDMNVSLEKHKLKVTYNTDESTLEADPFEFAFYGRPIFLQEKRPFFSKDLDIYNTPVNLFYTRAIQNINWGLNYTYRSDHLKTGIAFIEEEKGPSALKRKFFTARPSLEFRDFSLGGTFIYSSDPSNSYQERIAGIDGLFKLPSRFRLRSQYASNFSRSAYSAHLYYEFDYTGGPWGDLVYRRFDKDFSSITMFNNYGANNDEIIGTLGYKWTFDRAVFADILVGTEYYRAAMLDRNFRFLEYNSLFFNMGVNEWLRYSNSFEFNRPDEITEEGTVRRNNFLQEHSLRFIFGSYTTQFSYYFGKYLNTYLKSPSVSTDLILFDRLNLNLAFNYRTFSDVKQSIVRAKVDYKVMEKLYIRTFFQKDTYSRLALWNTLLQYEFFAGSNIYFVLNLEGPELQRTGRYFKIGYEFNF